MPDATLAHVIAFFWSVNDSFAGELLTRAERLFPDDLRWAEFRVERRAEQLSRHFWVVGIEVRSSVSVEGSRRRKVGTESDLSEIERVIPLLDPQSGLVPRLREAACELALARGDIERARTHAEQMLVSNAGDIRQRHGDAVHDGHLMLGRVALQLNDIPCARAHLILAGEAGAAGFVRLFGPDLRLAKELLALGEREVVVRYLTLVGEFWDRKSTDEWSAQIRTGRDSREAPELMILLPILSGASKQASSSVQDASTPTAALPRDYPSRRRKVASRIGKARRSFGCRDVRLMATIA